MPVSSEIFASQLRPRLHTRLNVYLPKLLQDLALLARAKKKLKKGAPKGKYLILRATFDKMYPPDVELYEEITQRAETKKMKLDEYCKWVLTEHVRN